MPKSAWINAENGLFDLTLGVPISLPGINVSEVKWLGDDPRNGVKAIVTLTEELSDSCFLLNLKTNGAVFDVLHRLHGPRDRYDERDIVAQFRNCEVLSKWVDDLVINAPDLIQVVAVYVQMRADFTMRLGF